MKPLRKFDIFSYGIGDFGINLHFQMINFFFAYFLTDIFGIPFSCDDPVVGISSY